MTTYLPQHFIALARKRDDWLPENNVGGGEGILELEGIGPASEK